MTSSTTRSLSLLRAIITAAYLATTFTNAFSTSTTTTVATNNSSCASSSSLISAEDIQKISRGGVAIIPNWLPPHLITSMHNDAQQLFHGGQFRPDGLTNTAIKEQGFSGKADRQTFRGDGNNGGGGGWDSNVGDIATRKEFADKMRELRIQLASALHRPTLATDGGTSRHEITYNWYEPGAKLARHLDEHHEETKGSRGWLLPTRRSVTWLVYLNEDWKKEEGGALRCFPRSDDSMRLNTVQVGSHEGNLQVGWINNGVDPVFLDVFRESGGAALYHVVRSSSGGNDEEKEEEERQILSVRDFNVPSQPIDFAQFLKEEVRESFAQISTARLDPRFAGAADKNSNEKAISNHHHDFDCSDEPNILDVIPTAGTLVLFDSVSLPHLVREVTGKRQRIAATGWFHEDSQFSLESM